MTRFDLPSLFEFVRARAVDLRGWDFPHVGERRDLEVKLDHIFQETDWEHHLDAWAMFRSGQFTILRGYIYDWRDQSRMWPSASFSKQTATIDPIETFHRMVELFEFALRITSYLEPTAELCVELTDRGLAQRRSRTSGLDYLDRIGGGRATIDEYPQSYTCTRGELLAEPVAPAIDFTRALFGVFDHDVPADLLRDSLQKLRR